MGFASFAGRVIFASVFLLSAYQEFSDFGVDGGAAAKTLNPKFDRFMEHVSSLLGIAVPHVEMRYVIGTSIFLKGLGGLLFILSSLLYLALITPVIYDCYNYEIESAEFAQLFSKFLQNMGYFGALLFFLEMKNSLPKRPNKKAPKSKIN